MTPLFCACLLNFHSMFSLKRKLGVVRSVRYCYRDFMAQSSFLFRLEFVLSSLDSVWVVCRARTSVLILCQVGDVIGVTACRAAQRWSHTPPVIFCRMRLFLTERVIDSVWTGVISRTLLNEWDCMNSTTPPLSVFSHEFKASHCSEPTFLFTSALM